MIKWILCSAALSIHCCSAVGASAALPVMMNRLPKLAPAFSEGFDKLSALHDESNTVAEYLSSISGAVSASFSSTDKETKDIVKGLSDGLAAMRLNFEHKQRRATSEIKFYQLVGEYFTNVQLPLKSLEDRFMLLHILDPDFPKSEAVLTILSTDCLVEVPKVLSALGLYFMKNCQKPTKEDAEVLSEMILYFGKMDDWRFDSNFHEALRSLRAKGGVERLREFQRLNPPTDKESTNDRLSKLVSWIDPAPLDRCFLDVYLDQHNYRRAAADALSTILAVDLLRTSTIALSVCANFSYGEKPEEYQRFVNFVKESMENVTEFSQQYMTEKLDLGFPVMQERAVDRALQRFFIPADATVTSAFILNAAMLFVQSEVKQIGSRRFQSQILLGKDLILEKNYLAKCNPAVCRIYEPGNGTIIFLTRYNVSSSDNIEEAHDRVNNITTAVLGTINADYKARPLKLETEILSALGGPMVTPDQFQTIVMFRSKTRDAGSCGVYLGKYLIEPEYGERAPHAMVEYLYPGGFWFGQRCVHIPIIFLR